jgi:hypothetical protein
MANIPSDQTLKNHEARIANLESDIRTLLTATRTQPNPNKIPVPSAPPDTSDIVVTAYQEIVIDDNTSDCEYTYSDGTKKRFHWKTTDVKGSWQTDNAGQNGHWIPVINFRGKCDDSALGLPKS